MDTRYEIALEQAIELMDTGLEPTSALKQAGSQNGISFGDEMGKFVSWANSIIFE